MSLPPQVCQHILVTDFLPAALPIFRLQLGIAKRWVLGLYIVCRWREMRLAKQKTRRSKPRSRPRDIADGNRLRQIRLDHKWSQEQLAKMLGVRQPLVSGWERGYLPSPKMYFKYSLLPLDYHSQRWLTQKAGADLKTLETIADGLRKERHAPPLAGETIRILPMPKIEAGGSDLVISAETVPHPYLTFYLRLCDNFMAPQFGRGDCLLVDTSETDPWKLEEGACVAIYRSPEHTAVQHLVRQQEEFEKSHPKEEVEERKRQMDFPYLHIGLFVGWLRGRIEAYTEGELGIFFLEAPWLRVDEMLSARQPHHPANAEISSASGLVVLGRVIGWFRGSQDPNNEQQT